MKFFSTCHPDAMDMNSLWRHAITSTGFMLREAKPFSPGWDSIWDTARPEITGAALTLDVGKDYIATNSDKL